MKLTKKIDIICQGDVMEYYGIGTFAKLIGVTQQGLRNWDKTGRLKPHHVGESGYRYYSQEQLYHYLGLRLWVIAVYQVINRKTTLNVK